jgi:hypothetical protein
MAPIQQMLLGSSGGANPIDFFGVPSPGNGNAYSFGNYDSKGNFNVFFNNNSWTNVKIKVDGTVEWSKRFASHSAGSFRTCDIGYNDILVCLGYTANDGLYLWGVSKDGALLWNKKYEINSSSFPTTGNTFYFSNVSSAVKAMTAADVAIICVGYNDTSTNSATNTLLFTVKVTDGTFIGWGSSSSGSDGRGFKGINGFAATINTGSTTGYWGCVSEDVTGSGNNQAQYRSWRLKGTFYTADHSGDKDILNSGSVNGFKISNDSWDGRVLFEVADALKTSSASNIDSATTWAGYRNKSGTWSGTYSGMLVNNSWTGTPYKVDPGGRSWIYGVAKLDSSTYFLAMYYISYNGDTGVTLLVRVSNNSVTWCKRLKTKDSSNNDQQLIPKKLYVDVNGNKGMLICALNFTPTMMMAQFDTGATAPSNGTYTFDSGVGSVTVDNHSVSMSTWNRSNVSSNVGWRYGASHEFKPENTTWSTQSLTDASKGLSIKEWT